MQTLKFSAGATRCAYTLSPVRNVGELQAKLSKCTGKTRRAPIKACKRHYPVFAPGMSTADYVQRYESANGQFPFKPGFYDRATLNSEPCTLYSGEDLHEIVTDGCELAPDAAPAAQDAPHGIESAADAPMVQEPAADALASVFDPAPAPSKVTPYPGASPERGAVYRVHLATVAAAVSAGIMAPIVPGPCTPLSMDQPSHYLRWRRAPEFSAPAVRMLRARIAAAVRADRAARRAPTPTPGYAFSSAQGEPPATHSQTPRADRVRAFLSAGALDNRPCAAPGLTSYRARGRYGWIMIGAKDDADAMREALRSTDAPTDLQVWSGAEYVPCVAPDAAPPAGQSERPANLTWQVLSAQPTTIYCTPVYRIGVHEWCMVVYAHDTYAACTDQLWRRVDQNRGVFKRARDWPTYDSDRTHSGLPISIGKKVFDPNRDAIEATLADANAGILPAWAPDDTRRALRAGIEARARWDESIARTSAAFRAKLAAPAAPPATHSQASPAPAPVESAAPPVAQSQAKRRRAKRPPVHYGIFNRHGDMVSWALGTISARNHLIGRISAWENHPDAPHTVRRALPGECAAFSDARRAKAIAETVNPLHFNLADRARFEVRPSAALHAARYRAPDPVLRIPEGDPRARIPARFVPSYLLQGAAQ